MFKKGLSKIVRYMSILRSDLDSISSRIMSRSARDRFQKLRIGSTLAIQREGSDRLKRDRSIYESGSDRVISSDPSDPDLGLAREPTLGEIVLVVSFSLSYIGCKVCLNQVLLLNPRDITCFQI